MHRSRSYRLFRASVLTVVPLAVAALLGGALEASAATPVYTPPKLAYVFSTKGVAEKAFARLGLTPAEQTRMRALAFTLNTRYRDLWAGADPARRSDPSLRHERAEVAAAGSYDAAVRSEEASGFARARRLVGAARAEQLAAVVDSVWTQDAVEQELYSAERDVQARSVTAAAVPTGSFRIYATQFGINDFNGSSRPAHDWDGSALTLPEWRWQVALPDQYAKFANWGIAHDGYPSGVFAVSLSYTDANGKARNVPSVRAWDSGPWNVDDNWWNADADPVRPRRIYDHLTGKPGVLPLGVPEAQQAYYSGYYGVRSPYPYSSGGQHVANPAGIDLGLDYNEKTGVWRSPYETSVAYALGLEKFENAWITVTPLWEARLGLSGAVSLKTKPVFTGQDAAVTYTVKNLGSLSGTWEKAALWPAGASVDEHPSDLGSFTLAPGQSKTFTFTKQVDLAGTHTWAPWTRRAGAWSQPATATLSFPVLQRTVARLQGSTRYDTAVKASQAAFPTSAPVVVLATGEDFPDALAGAPLAHLEGGPLLLTQRDTVPASVETEISRLHPSRVIILGNEKAVSKAVATRLATILGDAKKVARINGANRFDTARQVAIVMHALPGGPPLHGTAVIATGMNYPDALAGSVLAASKGWPVLLVQPDSLPKETSDALKSLATSDTVVLGGTASVSKPIYGKLPKPRRVGGADRYETAALVADEVARVGGGDWKWVAIATGRAFPDALSGGALAAVRHGMLLLTDPKSLPAATRARLAAHRNVTATLQAFGSTSALSDAVLAASKTALR